jgi:mitochondrial fission protein ELM1
MNILWISDGKKGHEKQVEILLNEISKTENIIIKKEILLVSKLSQLTRISNILNLTIIWKLIFE